ncbi:P-loop NTPase [Pleomorphomonas sp. NRK KF1]|uniref:nucleotide-binding protein n=1 Tax=Pleomorphomonas sp. NRK KF1 TaxID=2943000 RepID=UPI0020440B32|nr:ATP-binding protein [Pleomorphomonas sp. NRK KF1]MCM5552895.1 ATP-binding protein [Pleomorphomonas sp. NRK KF1]
MKIAIASGKGGTGKTTLAVNLAVIAGRSATLVDCDVEEPNAHIFLKGDVAATETVSIRVPVIDENRCSGCRACVEFCSFNALISFGGPPLFFPDLCHGCGGCRLVCRSRAISEVTRPLGEVRRIDADLCILVEGCLEIGVSSPVPVIKAAKAAATGDFVIYDAPPGTSCPLVATLRGADYVLLVTEPTPFGLSDLRLTVEVLRQMNVEFGVVINRAVRSESLIHDYCHHEAIEVLGEIPEDRRIAEAYAAGRLIVDALPGYRPLFRSILEACLERVTA